MPPALNSLNPSSGTGETNSRIRSTSNDGRARSIRTQDATGPGAREDAACGGWSLRPRCPHLRPRYTPRPAQRPQPAQRPLLPEAPLPRELRVAAALSAHLAGTIRPAYAERHRRRGR